MLLKIINEDNIKWLQTLPNNSVDIIFTSPPYNLGNKFSGDVKVNSYQDNLIETIYQERQVVFLNECYRVLKPTGIMFYNHKNRYIDGISITPYDWINKSDFKVLQEIIWNRITTVDYNRTRFANLTERVYMLVKDAKMCYKFKQEAVKFTDIWNITRPTPRENFNHDATFPVELVYRALLSIDCTPNELVVIDPYGGTGTVAQAAKALDFKECWICEINDKWNQVINTKINMEFNKEELPSINGKYDKNKKLLQTIFDIGVK